MVIPESMTFVEPGTLLPVELPDWEVAPFGNG
jgi:hypothetical protein